MTGVPVPSILMRRFRVLEFWSRRIGSNAARLYWLGRTIGWLAVPFAGFSIVYVIVESVKATTEINNLSTEITSLLIIIGVLSIAVRVAAVHCASRGATLVLGVKV